MKEKKRLKKLIKMLETIYIKNKEMEKNIFNEIGKEFDLFFNGEYKNVALEILEQELINKWEGVKRVR